MANIRGSIPFMALGQDMTMRAGFGAMERFSAATGQPFVASVQRLQTIDTDPSVPALLIDLAMAMISPKPERGMVSDLIDDVGLKEFLELLAAAVTAAFPSAPEDEAADRP